MPPVAAAVSPVRKSRVEKHGRELAVGGSVGRRRHGSVAGRNGNRAVGRERIIRVIRRNRASSRKPADPAKTGTKQSNPLVPNQIRYRTALHSERRGFRRNFNKKADHPIEQSADLSGRLDSNQRPPTPEAGALTGLRYTPNNIFHRN